MLYYAFFACLGYLLGSILFALVFGRLFSKKDITKDTIDRNPGTANAFAKGGFICGVFTIIFELLKGFAPVFLCIWCRRFNFLGCEDITDGYKNIGLALVLVAPVLGHILPVFFSFKGGKGIAVTFGSLLGLLPDFSPVLIFALIFIFFSLVVIISPNFYRTIVTYALAAVLFLMVNISLFVKIGFCVIAVLVLVRMHFSDEEREIPEVKLLWMH